MDSLEAILIALDARSDVGVEVLGGSKSVLPPVTAVGRMLGKTVWRSRKLSLPPPAAPVENSFQRQVGPIFFPMAVPPSADGEARLRRSSAADPLVIGKWLFCLGQMVPSSRNSPVCSQVADVLLVNIETIFPLSLTESASPPHAFVVRGALYVAFELLSGNGTGLQGCHWDGLAGLLEAADRCGDVRWGAERAARGSCEQGG